MSSHEAVSQSAKDDYGELQRVFASVPDPVPVPVPDPVRLRDRCGRRAIGSHCEFCTTLQRNSIYADRRYNLKD